MAAKNNFNLCGMHCTNMCAMRKSHAILNAFYDNPFSFSFFCILGAARITLGAVLAFEITIYETWLIDKYTKYNSRQKRVFFWKRSAKDFTGGPNFNLRGRGPIGTVSGNYFSTYTYNFDFESRVTNWTDVSLSDRHHLQRCNFSLSWRAKDLLQSFKWRRFLCPKYPFFNHGALGCFQLWFFFNCQLALSDHYFLVTSITRLCQSRTLKPINTNPKYS